MPSNVKDLFSLQVRSSYCYRWSTRFREQMSIALGEAGAQVVVADLNLKKKAQKVASHIQSLGVDSLALCVDVTKKGEVGEMVEKTLERFGKIDILFVT